MKKAVLSVGTLAAHIRGRPDFAIEVERLTELVAAQRSAGGDGVRVPTDLAEKAEELVVRLATVAFFEMAAKADVDLARRLVEACWRMTMPSAGSGAAAQEARHVPPWQLSLAKKFETLHLSFPRASIVAASTPAKLERALLATVGRILERLVKRDALGDLPPQFVEAAMDLAAASSVRQLRNPTRDRVKRAVQLLGELIVRTETPQGPKASLKITFDKAGGARRSKLSPWGAAARFAQAFDVRTMPLRQRDAMRAR